MNRAAVGMVLSVACSITLVGSAFGQASFQGLGDLPGGQFFSSARGISGDGRVVVGVSVSANGGEPFRCEITENGPVMISLFPGNGATAYANAASFDGSVVVGANWSVGVFRWTAATGAVFINGSEDFAPWDATDVSADGSVVVGHATATNSGCFFPETNQAFRWSLDGGLTPLPHPFPGTGQSSLAYTVTGDGSKVGGQGARNPDCEGETEIIAGVVWHNGVPVAQSGTAKILDFSPDGFAFVAQPPAGNGVLHVQGQMPVSLGTMNPVGVTNHGRIVVGNMVFPPGMFKAAIWDAQHGARDLQSVLLNDFDVQEVAGWWLFSAAGVSDDGTVIAGVGFNPSGVQEAWVAHLPKDTDGDGLLDDWEVNGIPYTDINGDEQRYILDVDGDRKSDADPMHKDLFVELDMMTGLTFPQSAVDAVVFAFETAPLMNPDGTEGITLHIVVDDSTLPFEAVTQTPDGGWPPSAPQLKADWFGTSAERSDASSAALLDAKRQAYRYCIQMNEASESVGGLGETPGDDFILFSGTYPEIAKASVFMHELGHNLGLDHGGLDDVNGKPNYPSIMNYVLAYKQPWNASFWRLDFSRQELAMVDEANLDEAQSVGTSFYSNFMMPYYGIVSNGAACYPPIQWGQSLQQYLSLDPISTTDYNLDCDDRDIGVAADLNYLPSAGLPGSVQPSPGELMVGCNDWAHVQLAVTDGGGAFAGLLPQDELTDAQRDFMQREFAPPPGTCLADVNGTRSVDVQDLLAIINAWGPCANIALCPGDIAPGVGDGSINVADLLAVINAWGPCR